MLPLIGYLILFNDKVVRFLEIARELGPTTGDGISNRLVWIYFGLCAVAAGTVVYARYCPAEIKAYGDKTSFTNATLMSASMHMFEDYERRLIASEFKKDMETLRQNSHGEYRQRITRLYHDYLNYRHPTARASVTAFFAVGIFCLLVPSAEVFWKVVLLVVGKLAN
ncbi:MAG: hypothetical protein ABIL01_31800 [Pseudomonadota bacterium]